MADATITRPPPATSLAHSQAFREASLKSEIRRAYVVTAVLVLILSTMIIHTSSVALDTHVKVVGVSGIGALIALQFAAIAMARRAARAGRGMPLWFSVGSVILECLVPSGMILSHIVRGTLPPYAALSAPPVLGYGLMIALMTLRGPGLCLLAGAVCAGGYTAVLLYVVRALGLTEPTTGLPFAAYFNKPLIVLITAIAAAWVARELRTHMEAALVEAETRRKMDRLEHDLAVARSIQRALLPRGSPDIPGFEIAGWNRPADQTGGDYYDWQALPDGNWIITLADVSGHGIGPAMVTAACRAYMRASSSHHKDQASLTSQINRLLAEDLEDGRFVTMVSVLINPRGGPLSLLSAGHGPIVLYVSSTGETRDIMPGDMPLAIVPDHGYSPAQPFTLEKGDILALVTDGFVEWPRKDENGRRQEFGLKRLRDSLRRHASLPPASLIEAVAADVAAFAGNYPQQDDLTMVIIRRVA